MSRKEILAAIREGGENACRKCGGIQHKILTEHGYLRRLAQSAARSATAERVQKVNDSKAMLAKFYDEATEHLAAHEELAS